MIDDILEFYPDEFLKADGFDEAIIGVDERTMRLIYSVSKVIKILMGKGMNYEDAEEYYYYNIEDAYVGDKTPIWCQDNFYSIDEDEL